MKFSRAFTLIELLIVITIIGILATAFLPQLLNAPSLARDTTRADAIKDYAGILTALALEVGITPDEEGGGEGNDDGFPASGCIVGDQVPEKYLADFGGQPPSDPDPENQLAMDPEGYFGEDDSHPQCQGGFGILLYPRLNDTDPADYDFGLYAHVENLEKANSVCSVAYMGIITEPDEETDETQLCYTILVSL